MFSKVDDKSFVARSVHRVSNVRISLFIVCIYTNIRSSNFGSRVIKSCSGKARMDSKDKTIMPPRLTCDSGFGREEMVACDVCRRLNPPNRLDCLYCALPLDTGRVDLSKIRLIPRQLENWENGFNVIAVSAPAELAVGLGTSIAGNTAIDAELISAVAGGRTPLPLSRVETAAEVEIVQANLLRAGIATVVVRDAELEVNKLPVRCGSIAFDKDCITFWPLNSGTAAMLPLDHIRLIVTGVIFESTTESLERRRTRAASSRIETETSSDMPLVDIYTDRRSAGFRIPASGFDFSCLGAEKTYLASKNFEMLLEKLARFCPAARFVSAYRADRGLLDLIWKVDEKNDSQGTKRLGLLRRALKSETKRSNVSQFTKYSRLHRHFL